MRRTSRLNPVGSRQNRFAATRDDIGRSAWETLQRLRFEAQVISEHSAFLNGEVFLFRQVGDLRLIYIFHCFRRIQK
jgi:hypothetical protein